MKGFEAREIFNDMKHEGKTVNFIGDYDEVDLNGRYTVEELHAI